jgi:osmotically-inducible protein OsmY
MDKSIDLSKGHAASNEHRTPDEKTVLGLGILAFCLVAALSIATRLGLEISAAVVETQDRALDVKPHSLARGDILVPVTLSLKIENGKATLRGTVPDETSRDTLLDRASQIYGQANVVDRLGIQPGVVLTPWFDSVLKWFPPKVAEIRSGEISVNGMNVLLFGQVADISARIAAGGAVAKLIGQEGQLLNDLQVKNVNEADAPGNNR